jgi:hypothetical protein
MIFTSVCPPARLSHGPQQPLCPGCPPFPNPQLATAAASRGDGSGLLAKGDSCATLHPLHVEPRAAVVLASDLPSISSGVSP